MILFLTSSPCDDDIPKSAGIPCGLFRRNHFVENMKRYWKPDSRTLIISAFPDNYPADDEMADTFYKAFAYHGLTMSRMEILDNRTRDRAPDLIRESDMIILGGGHVPTENAFFKEIGLRELLTGYPGIIMGISAGTMNCAETVYVQPELAGESLDPDFVKFTPGLGLTQYNVLPHYQMVRDNILDGRRLFEDITYPDSMGHTFYVLPDASYIMEVNGRGILYGQAWALTDGILKKICEDETQIQL